jgi:hypothetical protein
MRAALPAIIPFTESSSTKHLPGCEPRVLAQCRNTAG